MESCSWHSHYNSSNIIERREQQEEQEEKENIHDSIVTNWQSFGCNLEECSDEQSLNETSNREKMEQSPTAVSISVNKKCDMTCCTEYLMSSDYTQRTLRAMLLIAQEAKGVITHKGNETVNGAQDNMQVRSEQAIHIDAMELLSLIVESPSLMETLVQLYSQFTQQYKDMVAEHERQLTQVVFSRQSERANQERTLHNVNSSTITAMMDTYEDTEQVNCEHKVSSNKLLWLKAKEVCKIEAELQSTLYEVMRTAASDSMAQVLTHLQSSFSSQQQRQYDRHDYNSNLNLVHQNTKKNSGSDTLTAEHAFATMSLDISNLINEAHMNQFAPYHVPVQTILIPNPLLSNYKAQTASNGKNKINEKDMMWREKATTGSLLKTSLTLQTHNKRLDRVLQPIVFDLSPVSSLLDCLCCLDEEYEHLDTTSIICNNNAKEGTECQTKLELPFLERKENTLRAIQSHLTRLACGKVDLLWLIGTKEDALTLLQSTKLPELLLPRNKIMFQEMNEETLQGISEKLQEKEELENSFVDPFVRIGHCEEAKLYITVTTRLWGAHVILLWEPSWLEENCNRTASSPSSRSDETHVTCEVEHVVEIVMQLTYSWRVSMFNVTFLGENNGTVSANQNKINPIIENSAHSSEGSIVLHDTSIRCAFYSHVISAMSLYVAKVMASSCATKLSELWPSHERSLNRLIYSVSMPLCTNENRKTGSKLNKTNKANKREAGKCSVNRTLFETSTIRPTMVLSSPLAWHPFAVGAKDKQIKNFTSVETCKEDSINDHHNFSENINYYDNDDNLETETENVTALENAKKSISKMWNSTAKTFDWVHFAKMAQSPENNGEECEAANKPDSVFVSNDLHHHYHHKSNVTNMSLTFNTPVAIRIFLPIPASIFDNKNNNNKMQTSTISNEDVNIKSNKQAKSVNRESLFTNVFTTKSETAHKDNVKSAQLKKKKVQHVPHSDATQSDEQTSTDDSHAYSAQGERKTTTINNVSTSTPLSMWLAQAFGEGVTLL